MKKTALEKQEEKEMKKQLIKEAIKNMEPPLKYWIIPWSISLAGILISLIVLLIR